MNYFDNQADLINVMLLFSIIDKECQIIQSSYSFPSSVHFPSDKDVIRTDRTIPDFKDGDSCKLRQLEDILKTYVWYNFDLGE